MIKYKNKFIAILLCIVMTLSFFLIVRAEEENDVIEQIYLKNIHLLSSLQLCNFPETDYKSVVSRAEFAGIMFDFLNLDKVDIDVNVLYTDVGQSNSFADKIYSMREHGYMSGYSSSYFGADEPLTTQHALCVIVRALGYEVMANVKGGYSEGYINVANRLKISGASVKNENVTWSVIAQMLVDTLDIEVNEISGIGKYIEFSTSEDRDFLKVFHNISKKTGVITDNGVTALNGASSVGDGQLICGGIQVLNCAKYARDYIGNYVELYYKEIGGDNYFVYVTPNYGKNKTLEITADMLQTDSHGFNRTNIVYKDNGKQRTARLDSYADLIYNSSAYPEWMAETMKIKSGKLRLISNDGDNTYDVIIVEEFEDIKLAVKDTDKEVLYDAFSRTVDYGKYEFCDFYDFEGAETRLDLIPIGSIISVYKSKDNTAIKLVSSEKTVSAMVDGTFEENGVQYVIVLGEDKKISHTLIQDINNSKLSIKPVEIGKDYLLYFNAYDEISFTELVDAKSQYAYCLDVGKGTGRKSSVGQIKVVTESGDCIIIDTAKKVLINRASNKVDGYNIAEIAEFFDNGEFVPQLIKIRINSKGELTEIETAKTTNNVFGFDNSNFSLDYTTSRANQYAYTAKNYDGGYAIGKNTKIFLIDESENITFTSDEERVRIIPYSKLPSGYTTAVKMYDVDETWIAAACVIARKANFDDRIFIVNKVKQVRNEDDEYLCQITGYWKGSEWIFSEAEPGLIKTKLGKEIKKGDIIRFALNENTEITNISLLVSAYEKTNPFVLEVEGALSNGTLSAMFGYPYAKSDTGLGVYAKDKYWVNTFSTSTYCTVIDLKNDIISMIDKKDIPTVASVGEDNNFYRYDDNTMVFVWRNRGYLAECVVIKY